MMKNIDNILCKLAAVIAAALLATACLEKVPGDLIPEEQGMKTLSDAARQRIFSSPAHKSCEMKNNYEQKI